MILLERNFNKLLLTALLVGAVSTAFAIDPPYGDNLNYAMDGTTLVLTSPNSAQSATIYASAFLDRTDITAVIFPDNLTEINSEAFRGCTGLTEIVIPPSVTNIGGYAFYDCSSSSEETTPSTGLRMVMIAMQRCWASGRISI